MLCRTFTADCTQNINPALNSNFLLSYLPSVQTEHAKSDTRDRFNLHNLTHTKVFCLQQVDYCAVQAQLSRPKFRKEGIVEPGA